MSYNSEDLGISEIKSWYIDMTENDIPICDLVLVSYRYIDHPYILTKGHRLRR